MKPHFFQIYLNFTLKYFLKPTSYRLVQPTNLVGFTTLVKFTKNTFFSSRHFSFLTTKNNFSTFWCWCFMPKFVFKKVVTVGDPAKPNSERCYSEKWILGVFECWSLEIRFSEFSMRLSIFINEKSILKLLSFNFWGFCPKISLKTWILGDFFNVLNGIYKLTKVNYVWFLFHKFTKWNMCPTASIRLFLSDLDRKFYSKLELCVLVSIFWTSCTKIHKNEF